MSEVRPAPTDAPAALSFSVARAAVLRLVAEGGWAFASLVTGALVAQQLGSDGKGVAASLGYLVALVAPLVTLGIGDASVTLVRSGKVSWRDALDATSALLVLSWLVGMGVFVLAALLQFDDGLAGKLDGSIVLGALSVPAFTAWSVLTLFVEAKGRMTLASAAKLTVGGVTTVATAVLVMKLGRGVAGAIAGGGLGFAAGGLVLLVAIALDDGLPRPRWRTAFLRQALGIGIPIQLSLLLVGASARADLLIVQSVAGGNTAGFYSVALTASQLVSYGAVALSATAFPVVAGLDDRRPYVERLVRTAVAVSLGSALVLGALLPFVVPFAFGEGFRQAVPLTYLLLPAGTLYGPQWVLCRAWAAAGRGRVLLWSFGTSTVVMLVGDVLLIPRHGAAGGGIASVVAGVVGLVVAAAQHHHLGGGSAVDLLVPRPADLATLVRRRPSAG